MVVGSGRATDVPSEPRAASVSAMLRYSHDAFPGSRYRPVTVPADVRSGVQRRLLLAVGYAEQAAEAEALAEAGMAAQAEVLEENG
jgi:hypothetical protein